MDAPYCEPRGPDGTAGRTTEQAPPRSLQQGGVCEQTGRLFQVKSLKPARGSPLAMVRDMFRLAMIHGYGAVSSSTRWTPTATCSAGGWTGLHCLDDVSQQRARRACALTMSCDRPLSWRTEALDAALRTAGDTRQKQVASHGACAVTSTWGGPGGVLRLRRGRPPHEGGARRTSTREEDEQGAPFLMRLYMLVNLSRSSWIQRLL